jgi:DNA-binding sugar fermentation-stimulating protein
MEPEPSRGGLGPISPATAWHREVRIGRHRLDFSVTTGRRRWLVVFAAAAAAVARVGVRLLAYTCRVTPQQIAVLRRIPVEIV